MELSREMRRLEAKWQQGTGWPKRLTWIEIKGLRGWESQRFSLNFPIMAVVGENGVGKSTILQACASVYRSPRQVKKDRFASDFFPETPWDSIRDAQIAYEVREGDSTIHQAIRKPTGRWRGNPERPKRHVEYFDLRRIQPVSARVGYTRLANPGVNEVSAIDFERTRLSRFSAIMGKTYDLAKMALTDADVKRTVPVIGQHDTLYSGFHQGGGETTTAELLQRDIPRYSLLLIDEIESSLHPRAQRRLVRDLAALCRESELQVVLTTHSPYVLEELPLAARACIIQTKGRREIVIGVSPEFAMTKMDDVQHAECDLYVEDHHAAILLGEILIAKEPSLRQRCRTIPFGAASVGKALGGMVQGERFPRPTCVFLDGDSGEAEGCFNLPGDDAPEQVVFHGLKEKGWARLHVRTGRDYAAVADACGRAMTIGNHHAWVENAANGLFLGSDLLWQLMCAEWAATCLTNEDATRITLAIDDALIDAGSHVPQPEIVTEEPEATGEPIPATLEPSPQRRDVPDKPESSSTSAQTLFD